MLIVIGIIVADFVVVGTGHQDGDSKVALGGETHTKGKVAVGTHVVAYERAKTQANNGADHPSIVELVTQIGVERHQSAIPVEINAKTHTSEDVAVEIEAVSGRKTDAVGHVLVEMPGVALFEEALIAARNADLGLLFLSEHAHCHEQHDNR